MPYKDPVVRKEKARERGKLWRQNNPDRCKAKQRRWRSLNPGKRREYFERYRKRELERQRQRRIENPENARGITRRHYLKKRDYYRRKYQERRARKIGATFNADAVEGFISGIRTSKRVACYYCRKMVNGKKAHIDHVVPLSKGGPHAVGNLCASCPQCNWSKNDTMLQDWMRLGQQLLAL